MAEEGMAAMALPPTQGLLHRIPQALVLSGQGLQIPFLIVEGWVEEVLCVEVATAAAAEVAAGPGAVVTVVMALLLHYFNQVHLDALMPVAEVVEVAEAQQAQALMAIRVMLMAAAVPVAMQMVVVQAALPL